MDPRVKTIILGDMNERALDEVDATACAEKDFETVSLTILKKLYPNCHVFPFKPLVDYAGTGWRPDIAIVDKAMGYWFVIEIEVASHSLQRHILPQVNAFRHGTYGEEAALKLSEAICITPQQAATLIKHIPLYIAVVSNRDDKDWETALAANNVQFISISAFESPNGTSAHMVIGSLKVAERSLCFGTVYASNQVIRMHASNWKEQDYRITDIDGTSQWTCMVREGFAWITKRKGMLTLKDKSIVQILSKDDGSYLLRTLL